MHRDPLEVLSAFVDGEELDAAVLSEALMAPGAREALIDFVELKAGVRADDTTPSRGFYVAMDPVLRPVPIRTRWRRRVAAGLAAAALLTLGVLVGLFLRSGTPGGSDGGVPPPPSREVRFTEGIDWFRS